MSWVSRRLWNSNLCLQLTRLLLIGLWKEIVINLPNADFRKFSYPEKKFWFGALSTFWISPSPSLHERSPAGSTSMLSCLWCFPQSASLHSGSLTGCWNSPPLIDLPVVYKMLECICGLSPWTVSVLSICFLMEVAKALIIIHLISFQRFICPEMFQEIRIWVWVQCVCVCVCCPQSYKRTLSLKARGKHWATFQCNHKFTTLNFFFLWRSHQIN